jgi:RNA polymerase sigma-70 factor (ECF subfamily)
VIARDLLRYATQRVGQFHAEDIVAQTFLTAYEQRQRFDASRGDLLPWLHGICTNLLRRHRRDEIRAITSCGTRSASFTCTARSR